MEDIIRLGYRDKVVLITGGGGCIGSELARNLCRLGIKKLILFEISENALYNITTDLMHLFPDLDIIPRLGDIKCRGVLEEIFQEFNIDYVFHAAASKYVLLAEKYPYQTLKNNVFGSKNLAELAYDYKVEKFIFISTDKAVNPIGVMGMTKRLTELMLKNFPANHRTNYVIVRFGNVIESDGGVVSLFIRQIKRGGPVLVTHPEACRFFMSLENAVRLILTSAVVGEGNDVFIPHLEEPIKIVELAEKLIELFGLRPYKDIKIVFTGLKEGEKLKEELFYPFEEVEPTGFERILKVKNINSVNKENSFDINKYIEDFLTISERLSNSQIKEKLKEIIKYVEDIQLQRS